MLQREIYDERYLGTGYDERSSVRVLTAEASALRCAVQRAVESLPDSTALSLLDFGYGTGRVTNTFAAEYPVELGAIRRDLRVVAYDVSSVGLRKATTELVKRHGFDVTHPLDFHPGATEGYIAGSVSRLTEGCTVTVTFVHGTERADPDEVRTLVEKANDGQPFALTTSWYSALAHIPTAARRAAYFQMLDAVTDSRGELLIAPSVSGDLVQLQAEWTNRLRAGDVGEYPIEQPGDVIYETEIGQKNFYHVFGADLAGLLDSIGGPGRYTWMEAIRMPDPEFDSKAAELDNYRRVREFNERLGRQRWQAEEYLQVHTALAVRSGNPHGGAGALAGSATMGPPAGAGE
ncbi:hypothetical protein [Actinoplanes sp. GCM10030250]|uniref:hypothetical protein n=1 Tax=Actinoplanes sp. GCM10030250 TaxID=3273376 RepID=UPI003614019D